MLPTFSGGGGIDYTLGAAASGHPTTTTAGGLPMTGGAGAMMGAPHGTMLGGGVPSTTPLSALTMSAMHKGGTLPPSTGTTAIPSAFPGGPTTPGLSAQVSGGSESGAGAVTTAPLYGVTSPILAFATPGMAGQSFSSLPDASFGDLMTAMQMQGGGAAALGGIPLSMSDPYMMASFSGSDPSRDISLSRDASFGSVGGLSTGFAGMDLGMSGVAPGTGVPAAKLPPTPRKPGSAAMLPTGMAGAMGGIGAGGVQSPLHLAHTASDSLSRQNYFFVPMTHQTSLDSNPDVLGGVLGFQSSMDSPRRSMAGLGPAVHGGASKPPSDAHATKPTVGDATGVADPRASTGFKGDHSTVASKATPLMYGGSPDSFGVVSPPMNPAMYGSLFTPGMGALEPGFGGVDMGGSMLPPSADMYGNPYAGWQSYGGDMGASAPSYYTSMPMAGDLYGTGFGGPPMAEIPMAMAGYGGMDGVDGMHVMHPDFGVMGGMPPRTHMSDERMLHEMSAGPRHGSEHRGRGPPSSYERPFRDGPPPDDRRRSGRGGRGGGHVVTGDRGEVPLIPGPGGMRPPMRVPGGQRAHHRGFVASQELREKTGLDIDTRSLARSGIELKALVEHQLIDILSRDQHGSRYIQACLEHVDPDTRRALFEQIQRSALSLCEDVFGNYVIQKLFEYGDDRTRIDLANVLMGRVLPLTKSMYGCRVIQKALECIEIVLRTVLISELRGHVHECVRDQNGNHVIQKAIEEIPNESIQFIVDAFLHPETDAGIVSIGTDIAKDVFHHEGYTAALTHSMVAKKSSSVVEQFAAHPYGCRVIQRLLEKCNDEQKQPLLDEILKQANCLSRDQYGNYVVQHILQYGTAQARRDILRICGENILAMSKHKFSSNVIEKCFIHTSIEERDELLDAVVGVRRIALTELKPAMIARAERRLKEDGTKAVPDERIGDGLESVEDIAVLERVLAVVNVPMSGIDERTGDSTKTPKIVKYAMVSGDTPPPLVTMVRDQFGNYVIQKVLEVSTEKQRHRLVSHINDLVPNLRKLMFGKHIIAKIEQLAGGHDAEEMTMDDRRRMVDGLGSDPYYSEDVYDDQRARNPRAIYDRREGTRRRRRGPMGGARGRR
jgi:pumilio RNA-binding family